MPKRTVVEQPALAKKAHAQADSVALKVHELAGGLPSEG